MSPLLRYRLVNLCLTTLLFIVALAYAAQTVHVATLRTQKRQLKQTVREQQEEIARLRLAPLNHAVYAFVLARLKGSSDFRGARLEVDDEELYAAYSSPSGFICSIPDRIEEVATEQNTNRAWSSLRIATPEWNGQIAKVRICFVIHPIQYEWVNLCTVEYRNGKVRLVKEETIITGSLPSCPIDY